MTATAHKTVNDIQTRLKEFGFDPGPIDGIRGRRTITALERYQTSMHLPATGIADPATLRALFGGAPVKQSESPDATPWIDYANRVKGLRESNPALKAFLRNDGATVGDPAKIPWCGDFVQTCIAVTLPREPLPDNPYAAINWLKFGKQVSPRKGAILVFWRGTPSSWQGHVGFYVGEDATHFHVLGGNQSDMVNVSRIAKSRMRAGGCRWPATALEIETGAVIASAAGLIETKNEE